MEFVMLMRLPVKSARVVQKNGRGDGYTIKFAPELAGRIEGLAEHGWPKYGYVGDSPLARRESVRRWEFAYINAYGEFPGLNAAVAAAHRVFEPVRHMPHIGVQVVVADPADGPDERVTVLGATPDRQPAARARRERPRKRHDVRRRR